MVTVEKTSNETATATAVRKNYVLVDQENVHIASVAQLQAEHFRVLLFIGPHQQSINVDLVLSMQDIGRRAKFIKIERSGPNALDFHIAYYLGVLSQQDPSGFFHIISKDTGFDPLITHLQNRNILSARSVTIEDMPCFKKKQPQNNPSVLDGEPTAATTPRTEVKHSILIDQQLTMETQLQLIINYLSGLTGKPASMGKLTNTVHTKCGKRIPLITIKAIVNELMKRGYIKLNGTKLDYALPP